MDTDDLVQDAFGRVFGRLDKIEPRRKKALRAYLRTAVQNRIHDEVRRAGRVETSMASQMSWADPASSPLSKTLDSEKVEQYRAALRSLPPKEQELLVARLEMGLSYDQVALISGKPSPDAARVAIRRAVLRLAEEMASVSQ